MDPTPGRGPQPSSLALTDYDAVIFDMDGVITDTAATHASAWKQLFDAHLASQTLDGDAGRPFTDDDYRRHVDGRPRLDGVETFLASRGIRLPRGAPDDAPDAATSWGLANRKQGFFVERLEAEGARAYPSSVALVRSLQAAGVRTAVVTASRNRREVLATAGIDDLFDAAVDGLDAAALGFPGKPRPHPFLLAAARLGVSPVRAVVVEDAQSGVQAGRRGGFGLVVGVDRTGSAEALRRAGADVVVTDLVDLPDALAGSRREPHLRDAWVVELDGERHATVGVRESLCTLGNGVFATRGAVPLEDPAQEHYPGTYAAGVFNRLTSTVHGRTHEYESLVNLPNWLPLMARAEDGPWLGGEGTEVLDDRFRLDLREGLLTTTRRVQEPDGRRTTIVERRLVSMATPRLAAVEQTIVPENWSGTMVVRASLDGRVVNANAEEDRLLDSCHLGDVGGGEWGEESIWLAAETVQSGIRVVEAARTRLVGEHGAEPAHRTFVGDDRVVAHELRLQARQGRPVVVEKVVALSTSRDRAISEPSLAARQALRTAGGFDELLADHALSWSRVWRRTSVALDDHAEAARNVNLHLFHLTQTLSLHVQDRDVGIPARGLHGEGYRGHIFWDELFVFPFLNLRRPDLSRALLLYRFRRLDAARRLAAEAGHAGAMYPWQSGSDGREETPTQLWNPRSGRWMPDNSRRQRHVGLAVAYNVWHHQEATGDLGFLLHHGAEIIIEVARFFASLVSWDGPDGRASIRGVMGPDEFHDGYPDRPGQGIDDNAYTNVMTAWLLARALEVVEVVAGHNASPLLERLGVTTEELAAWDRISRSLHVPVHRDGILSQFDGYEDLEELDWAAYRERYGNIGRLDLILEAEGDTPNRYKLSKQADVLMLFYLFSAEELEAIFDRLGYDFDPATIPRAIHYYSDRVSDGSTLSRVVHAWVLSRSHRDRSWHLFLEVLASDVTDIQGGTTREGIHLGAMAGSIDLLQRCYSGLELRDGLLRFNPRLPDQLARLELTLAYRTHVLDVTVTSERLEVALQPSAAPPVRIRVGDVVDELAGGDRRSFALEAPGS